MSHLNVVLLETNPSFQSTTSKESYIEECYTFLSYRLLLKAGLLDHWIIIIWISDPLIFNNYSTSARWI